MASQWLLSSFNLLLIISEVMPQRYELKSFIEFCFFLPCPSFFRLAKKINAKAKQENWVESI